MDEVKFDMNAIDNTFKVYKKDELYDCVVISKQEKGVICNIGGKSDGFVPASDFINYDDIKIGERFKIVITNKKNEEGMVEGSKTLADKLQEKTNIAQSLKMGSIFTFVGTQIENDCLISKLGKYKIIIPKDEALVNGETNLKYLINKQKIAMVVKIDFTQNIIFGSIKLPYYAEKERVETTFWNSIFINKVVDGVVKKIMPYGVFVDVDGVTCFAHISDLSHEHLNNPSQVVEEGKKYMFRVIKIDKDNKKVSLGIKQLINSPQKEALKALTVGEKYFGKVIKILQFGALIKLENGATGLLHISNATDDARKKIYEIVKLEDTVKVTPININFEGDKVSFKLL